MGYIKTNWVERVVQFANRFTKSGETSTEVTLTASPGTVTQAGTALSMTNLNKIEQALYLSNNMFTTAGTANSYSVTIDGVMANADVIGVPLKIKINVNSNAASTLNLGYGAIPIKKANGNNVTNLKANAIYTLVYDGTNFILQGEGGSGDATAADLLAGKTASVDAGDIVGTMVDRGSPTITPGASAVPISPGRYTGGTISAVSNLSAGNIASGVTVGGVAGTFTNDAVLDPAYLLTGYSGYDDGVKKNGTMPDRGAPTWTPGTANQGLAAGYYSGGTVLGDPDLVAGNIRSGVNIFGVVGTLQPRLFASGTVTSTPTRYGYDHDNDSGVSSIYSEVEVNGLGFTPVFVMVSSRDQWQFSIYNGINPITTGVGYDSYMYMSGNSTQGTWYPIKPYANGNPLGRMSIYNGGFIMPAGNTSVTFFWVAFG